MQQNKTRKKVFKNENATNKFKENKKIKSLNVQ